MLWFKKLIKERAEMFSRSEAIEVLKIHTVTIRDYKDFIKLVGIKNNYTIKELKHFLGY